MSLYVHRYRKYEVEFVGIIEGNVHYKIGNRTIVMNKYDFNTFFIIKEEKPEIKTIGDFDESIRRS